MARQPNSQSAPVAHSCFEWSNSWRTIEKCFGLEVMLPSQHFTEHLTIDQLEARRLALGIITQSLFDLERVFDMKDGLCAAKGAYAFTDEQEILAWWFNDYHFEEVQIDGEPEIPVSEEIPFSTITPIRTLHLEQESSGIYSMVGCCALTGLDAWGVRRILKRWIRGRENGSREALISNSVPHARRRRALEQREVIQQRQLENFVKASYPVEAIASAFHLAPATIKERTRKLLPPSRQTPRVPSPIARARNRQAAAFASMNMPASVIAHVRGVEVAKVSGMIHRGRAARRMHQRDAEAAEDSRLVIQLRADDQCEHRQEDCTSHDANDYPRPLGKRRKVALTAAASDSR